MGSSTDIKYNRVFILQFFIMRRHSFILDCKMLICADEHTYLDVQICDDGTDNVSIWKGMKITLSHVNVY